MMQEEYTTRGERRERKRRRRRNMGVSGASVRTLQDIILKKSRNARAKTNAGRNPKSRRPK